MTQHYMTYNNIRLIRTLRRISAKQLAYRAEYSQAYISRLECGKRRLNTEVLYRIARALGCSIHAIINPNITSVVKEITTVEEQKPYNRLERMSSVSNVFAIVD